jgi:hypothetical protein
MAKITMNMTSYDVPDQCEGIFSDLTSDDWQCKYVEAGVSYGFFDSKNDKFRKDDKISKWESIKMIMKARGLEKKAGFADDEYQKAYVAAAVDAGIIDAPFEDYNTSAVRSWIFVGASEAVDNTMPA